jgi:protein-S-isoprenylcysteine O-methyltransferase Ste14
VILILFKTVISREEMYLRDAFGAEYTGYAASVRRWL